MHGYRITRVALLIVVAVSAACGLRDEEGAPAGFRLTVTPPSVQDAAPGQRVVLLVTAEDTSAGRGAGEAVALSVTAEGADVEIAPAGGLKPGVVGEVTIIPRAEVLGATHIGALAVAMQPEPLATISVEISGEREGVRQALTTAVGVGADDVFPLADAEQVLALFLPWLAEQHPELGIGPDTQFIATPTKPHWLVVSHYLFFSERWEIGVRWHIMIPPDNWAEMYLRERFVEVQPTRGFKVDSWTPEPTEIYPVEVSEPVWR